jgi:hypothetical protein
VIIDFSPFDFFQVRNGNVLSTPFWISTSKGELGRKDEFDRGVMDRLVKDIATPSTAKGKNLSIPDSIQLIVHVINLFISNNFQGISIQ